MSIASLAENPLGHVGIDYYQNPPLVTAKRNPTSTDIKNPDTTWLNSVTKILYVTSGAGVWSQISPSISTSGVATITGNTGGAISPTSGNVNVVGSGSITVAGSGNTLTISATGSTSFTWNNNATTQTMSVNNGYIVTAAALQTLTLPATSAVGDVIEVIRPSGAGGWRIAQTAGQQVRTGTNATTVGTGGSLTSTGIGDCIHLVCTTANTIWIVDYSVGTITPV
jgi:hypothetical protein